ncbi:TlpA family protein disulfide reductase [Chitinophaga sp. RAB17]|uniref:TlpA family protein disulfide reductase n=1 Tax=Chitinophaga sp. RAB17 TaxID=3233049 RepID=UPI003F8DC550
MSRFPLLLALISLLGSTFKVAGQSKFKQHDSWLYRLEMNNYFSPDRQESIEKIYRITITGVNKDGSADAEAVLERALVKSTDNNYNTADPSTYKVNMGMMTDMLLLYHPLAFRIFANDSVGQPANTAAVGAVVGESLGLALDMRTGMSGMWKIFPYNMERMFAPFPAKVAANYQWTTGPRNYRVEEVQKDAIRIVGSQEADPSDKLSMSTTFSYTLSRSKRHVIAFKYDHRTPTGQPPVSLVIAGTQLPADTKVPAADTAFYNALVRLSYFSTSLDARGEADSARVAAFLALNVPRYGNNLMFKMALLNLNRSMSPYIREVYGDALNSIPSYALADNEASLFNKLQHVAAMDADSAMVLIKLLSTHGNSLNGWLDQSFSQYLLSEPFDTISARKQFTQAGLSEKAIQGIFEEARKMPVVAQEVINRLVMEKDSAIQASVKPMALWNKARRTTDTAILKDIAAQYSAVTPAEMTLGKAARYEIMVYGILRKARLHKEADALLDRTLEDLKSNQADTAFWTAHPELKVKKYANRNILAHVYHLKYEQTLPKDKKAALNYLALAAANAPKNNDEKAYDSFYDRSFLNSKEDYSPEFAEALTALGKPEEAMRVLSKQLMSNPDMLETAKNMFEKNFPDKSFQDYFRNVLLKEWEQAPDFTLTGLNNESYRLADYKGKWLLLDFWGTWCSPCRQDLPHLNQLAAEMKAGKHPGNAILAISCREPLETTREFVIANKYVFPAAHSDSKVEKLYNVRGYPTKVLVSPEGKMLDLQFGTDYTAILKMYSSIYAQQDKERPSTIKIDNKKKD